MENILQYVRSTFADFNERPISETDSLVFSALSYLHFSRVKDSDYLSGRPIIDFFKAEYFNDLLGVLDDDYLHLLAACAASPRFRHVHVFDFFEVTDSVAEKQFAVVSFQLINQVIYVAFRGTDSTFIGWREDFNLALDCPIPSQIEAQHYLYGIASRTTCNLIVGGHSKGGNLAVYSAAMNAEELNDRISAVYSHDGPGFLDDTLSAAGFGIIKDRIYKSVPGASIVGLLLKQEAEYKIVESRGHNHQQHNPFNWLVCDGSFVELKELTIEARMINLSVSEWMANLEADEIRIFIDTFFTLLESTTVSTFAELNTYRRELLPVIIRAAAELPVEKKRILGKLMLELAASGVKALPDALKNTYNNDEKKSPL